MKAAQNVLAAHFMTPLVLAEAGQGEWNLAGDLSFYSKEQERIFTAPKGFRTNLASVPRIPFAYLLFGGMADAPAALHDYLYTNLVPSVTREQADAIFAEASKVVGVPAWKRGAMWAGVRLFGGAHWGTGSPLVKAEEPDVTG